MPKIGNRRLVRIKVRNHFPCTYRKGCVNQETWYLITPFTNRYGNLKERHRSCCDACAVFIQQQFPGTREVES